MTTQKVQPNKDQAVITQLKAMGFSDEYVETPRRLICALEGLEFVGKTHFSLTAPEPIIFNDVDLGTEGVINKFQEQGKQILYHRIRVPKSADKDIYETLWNEFKNRIYKAYTLKRGTVVWDTESEINELARLAKFGKLTQVMPHHYQQVNRELRDIIDYAYDAPINTIFIRKLKSKWVDNVRTREYEASGWADMDYKCQVTLRLFKEETDEGSQFCAQIKKCRQNPDVAGEILRGPMCNFEFLLGLVHDK